jgi:hypothetical protein
MCGSATLATLVSSTSIKVASITVRAMIHGLMTRGWMNGRNASVELFCVERLHLAYAVRQVGTRLVIAVQRRDLVVAGARQTVLRL